MQNFDLEQNISDANASGREHSFAPWNNYGNPFNNSKKVKYGQSGRSMIEMLGVLAIIGVLSVGGIAGYSKAMMKYRVNKTIEQITLIAGNIRTFFGPQKNYIGVMCTNCTSAAGCRGVSGINSNGNPTYAENGCPIIKKAKILPDEMITVTDGKIMSITNPFGSGVYLNEYSKAQSSGSDYQAFSFYLTGIPQEACIELLTYDWSVANVGGIQAYSYGAPGMWKVLQPPVEIDKAVKYCSGNPFMHFYFDIDKNSEYWQTQFNRNDPS